MTRHPARDSAETGLMRSWLRGRKGTCRGLLGTLCVTMVFFASPAWAGDALTAYGDIAQYLIPAVAASVAAYRRDGAGLLQLGATSAATMGTTYALKYAVDRKRPNGGGQSFPSGHTASAFMGASYLHYRYGWQYGLPAYVAAAVVGYSRVAADQHYWEDVAASAVIANLSAYVLTDTLDENVAIVPVVDWHKHNFGLLAKLRF